MRLENKDFLQVVSNTPLVSIDLIVKDEGGRVLLGLRKNKPAQGYWFVPGGRIYKDEPIDKALARIGREEIGIPLDGNGVKFLGVFEHFYDENFSGEPGIGTHYVVLGCEVIQPITMNQLPDSQHEEWRLWELDALQTSGQVHGNTKAYFVDKPSTLGFMP